MKISHLLPSPTYCLLPLLSLVWGVGIPRAFAAERVTLRLGPFEHSVAVTDLERYAKTGEVSSSLKFYTPVLTPQVREALNRRLRIDPKVGDKLIDNLLQSSTGTQLLKYLEVAIPGSRLDQIQAAAALAIRQANGLSVVSFLQAYPAADITVDASAALALAMQFNPTYWQSQAIGPLLERELAVPPDPSLRQVNFDPTVLGPQPVQVQTLTFQDQQRKRSILVDLYLSANTQGPLVIMSHGFGADRKFLAYLARHLASYGLTVGSLEHPGSDAAWVANLSIGTDPTHILPAQEFIDRPKDVSFVLDELTKLNQQPGQFQGKFNTQQVSVIGHSLGGYTALSLAGAELNPKELRPFCQEPIGIGQAAADWLQCAAANLPNQKIQLKDERVKSAIALNPMVGHLFGKTGLTKVQIPILLLAGTKDALTPPLNHQLQPFTQLSGRRYLLAVIGGTHLSVGDPTHLSQTGNSSTLTTERQGEETKSLRQLLSGVSLAFIEQLTPAAKTYAPFLTPAYTQSFSTPELPLRLTQGLSANVVSWIEVAAAINK